MIIRSISVRTPSLLITNEDIIAGIRDANPEVAASEIDRYCALVERLLRRSGARTRFYRDRSKGETALSLIVEAAKCAMNDAGVVTPEIDAVIFCGVGRGFLEPANAAFVGAALGLTCDAFDVSEACMSWVRSLQIAQSLLLTRTYATVLIVNGEFTVFEYGLPEVNVIRSRDQLRHMFAAFTIGEAASATIVGASPERWRFRFRSDPTRADLCTVPIRGYDQFAMPSARLGLGGLYQLVAFSEELFIAAVEEMVRFVRDTYESPEVFDLWFPHAANSEICRVVARRLGLGNRVYGKTFESCGNLISASIPAAMAQAADDGRLKRGDHIVLCPASAGMSLALVDGRY